MKRSTDRSLNLGQILAQPLTNEGWVVLINNMAIRMFMALCGAKRFTFQELGWLPSYGHSSLGSAKIEVEAEEGLSLKTRGLFRYKKSGGFDPIEDGFIGTQETKIVWGFTMKYEWVLCWVTFEVVSHPIHGHPLVDIVRMQIYRTNLEDLLFHFKPVEIWEAFGCLAENFVENHRESYRVAQGAYDEWSRLHQLIDDLWVFEPSQDDSKTNSHTD
jgi:hypothetical protein